MHYTFSCAYATIQLIDCASISNCFKHAAHKRETGCTGKRDRTGYVKRTEFNDGTVLSDYKFLEEAKLVQEVAKRAKPPTPRFQLPQHLNSLVYQAGRKGVTLQIMSPGMERRRLNSTRYDRRNKSLSWRVEWSFVKAGCKAVNARASDNKVLWDLLQAHLNPPPGEKLKHPELQEYSELSVDSVVLALRKENTSAKEPRYYRIDPKSTVEDALKGKVIIEYPVFLVLSGDDTCGYEFEGGDS